MGYAYAPVEKTENSGWLWAWAWAMPTTTQNADAAWEFISWATGKEYEKLVGEHLGWSRLPGGKRTSTYSIAEYEQSATAFGNITLQSIKEAGPTDPGAQPRPALGIQFVGIPEFADLGTKVSQEVSAAIAGSIVPLLAPDMTMRPVRRHAQPAGFEIRDVEADAEALRAHLPRLAVHTGANIGARWPR